MVPADGNVAPFSFQVCLVAAGRLLSISICSNLWNPRFLSASAISLWTSVRAWIFGSNVNWTPNNGDDMTIGRISRGNRFTLWVGGGLMYQFGKCNLCPTIFEAECMDHDHIHFKCFQHFFFFSWGKFTREPFLPKAVVRTWSSCQPC